MGTKKSLQLDCKDETNITGKRRKKTAVRVKNIRADKSRKQEKISPRTKSDDSWVVLLIE